MALTQLRRNLQLVSRQCQHVSIRGEFEKWNFAYSARIFSRSAMYDSSLPSTMSARIFSSFLTTRRRAFCAVLSRPVSSDPHASIDIKTVPNLGGHVAPVVVNLGRTGGSRRKSIAKLGGNQKCGRFGSKQK